MIYEAQTLETAPEKSRPAMRRLEEGAGMIPNLAAKMSASPTLIEGFVTLREISQAGEENYGGYSQSANVFVFPNV